MKRSLFILCWLVSYICQAQSYRFGNNEITDINPNFSTTADRAGHLFVARTFDNSINTPHGAIEAAANYACSNSQSVVMQRLDNSNQLAFSRALRGYFDPWVGECCRIDQTAIGSSPQNGYAVGGLFLIPLSPQDRP